MSQMFKEPGCTCSSTGGLRAAVEGKPSPLCKIHDAEAIKQRDGDRARFERESELGRLHQVYASIKSDLTAAGQAECSCLSTSDLVIAHLSGKPPAPCPVHDAQADASSSVALNDDQSLAAVIGLPLHRSTHTDTDPPTAA